MWRDFHANFAAARRVYEGGSDALGLDLAALCFEEDLAEPLQEIAS